MTQYRNVAGAWKPVTVWRNIAGVWKVVTSWRNIAGVWKVISSLIVDFTVGAVTGGGTGTHQRVLTSSVLGSSGSLTYAWSISGQTGDLNLVFSGPSNTANATVTNSPVGNIGDTCNATVHLLVTDTVSGQTANVSHSVGLGVFP